MANEAQHTPLRGNSEVVAELAVRAAGKPELIALVLDDRLKAQVLAVPQGMRIEAIKGYLDAYRTEPERARGTAVLGDLESFIAHALRGKDKDSVLFARPGLIEENTVRAPAIEAVLNYNSPNVDDKDAPRFGDHRSRYDFPFSEEWKTWVKWNGKQLPQEVFAALIEDRLADVGDPDAASDELSAFFFERLGVEFATPQKLIELSRGLSVHVGQKVRNAQNLASGEAQVQFVEEHSDEAGKPLKVPGAFLLAIPVFQFGALYQVAARLRYRVAGGGITWFYELHRVDRIFDHAFREACKKAEDETGLPLFMGSPES